VYHPEIVGIIVQVSTAKANQKENASNQQIIQNVDSIRREALLSLQASINTCLGHVTGAMELKEEGYSSP
jgi:hypothetical protein